VTHDDDDDADADDDDDQSALPFALQQQLDLLQCACFACLLASVVPNQETRLSKLLLLG
jgi:hypothetical protein